MKILDIYEKYKIMPQLQEHQLRVAGVADLICENFQGEVERDNIIKACLLHDIGNIIKFDLINAHKLLNIDIDIDHWQAVKGEYIKKYGHDEHVASIQIAQELGVASRVLELIDSVSFDVAPDNAQSEDFGKKICDYADMRVAPSGVASLEERFADLRARYAHKHMEWGSEQKRITYEKSLREIERQIFAKCKITPEDITEEVVKEKFEVLRNYGI